jgi:hypothetical protein
VVATDMLKLGPALIRLAAPFMRETHRRAPQARREIQIGRSVSARCREPISAFRNRSLFTGQALKQTTLQRPRSIATKHSNLSCQVAHAG